jgi:hypothetical protein
LRELTAASLPGGISAQPFAGSFMFQQDGQCRCVRT